MTELTLNTDPIKNEYNNDETLENVIGQIFERELQNEAILVNIHLDGKTIPFEDGLEIAQNLVSDYEHIDFEVKSSTELAFEALDSCNDYIDLLVGKISNLTELYQKGESKEANELFNEVVDVLDLYIQLFAKIHTTLKRNFQDIKAHSKEIQDLDIHLLSILKALIPAKEKGDIIMLCDLLEYELVDNLTQWKIKIVPELKKLKGN